MTTQKPGPCPCWTGPAALHDGHCCFRYDGYETAERGEEPFCHDQPAANHEPNQGRERDA